MSVEHDFDEVDAFAVGAIGEPGQRTFFLQIRRDGTRVTVKCEKQQVAAIAEHLGRLLDDLPEATDRPIDSALQLAIPFDAPFVLGPVGLGIDRGSDRLLVQLDEAVAVDEEGEPLDDEAQSVVRLFVTRGQAAAFCAHATAVVAAGRPDCRWCGRPIDPDGHLCTRMN